MKNIEKEKEVLSQLYSNTADSIKYLPFFFSCKEDLIDFFDMFGGKTLKLPKTFEDFLENYLQTTNYSNKAKGINNIKKVKNKVLESYINLFPSLNEVIKNECITTNYNKEKKC